MRKFYTNKEERINAYSHAIGILLGLGACFYIFGHFSYERHHIWLFSISLYFIGMLSSYISSTIYHALPLSHSLKPFFRACDHATIYWHISGSYSPIALIVLIDYGYWGWIVFITQWIFAVIGTIISFKHLSNHSHLETACFVAMGCMIFLFFKPFINSTSSSALTWILSEGGCYLIGAAFYSLHKIRYMHSIFHVCVLAGTVCHIMVIWHILNYILS